MMKILITETQLKNIKGEMEEALGVPEGILETSEDLFNDFMDKLKRFRSVNSLEKGFVLSGQYDISGHVYHTINCSFELLKDPKYTPEIVGAGVHKQSELTSIYTLKHVNDPKEVDLRFRIAVTPDTTTKDIVNLFLQNPTEMITTFTHELSHVYYDSKKRGEKLPQRIDYAIFSSNNFANIKPLNEFLYYSYYIHAVENIVRPSELAQLMRLHGVNKKTFLEFFQKTEVYKNLKYIQSYTFDKLKDQLKENLNEIKKTFKKNKINYSNMTDEIIIDECLELFYVNLVNWKGDLMSQNLVSNMFEAILGLSGGKEKFRRKYLNTILKYQDNSDEFYKSECNRFNEVATKMIKKLAKLYDLVKNEE